MKKRLTAFILSLVFVLALFPPQAVFANLQNPIRNLIITNDSDISGTNYTLTIGWQIPSISTAADTQNFRPQNNGYQHQTEGYEISMRNATENEGFGIVDTVQHPAGATAQDYILSWARTETLTSGSIYAYRIMPYHVGTVEPHNRRGENDTAVPIRAPFNGTEAIALYLTDLNVTAVSGNEDKSVTVTWDNPTYNGNEVIRQYNIYYTPYTQDNEIPTEGNEPVVVNYNDDNLERIDSGRKLQFTFTGTDLQYGVPYALKVVPVIQYSGSNYYVQLQDNVTNLPIAFSGREYRTSFSLEPTLMVEEDSPTTVKLTWGSLATSQTGTVNSVTIQSMLSSEQGSSSWQNIGGYSGYQAVQVNTARFTKPTRPTLYRIIVEYEYPDGTVIFVESQVAEYNPSFTAFIDYSPTIYTLDYTESRDALNLSFLAFYHQPYDENQIPDPNYGNVYVDRDVTYDIWVTDDVTYLEDPRMAGSQIITQHGELLTLEPYTGYPFSAAVPGPVYTFTGANTITTYATLENGVFVKKPIEKNKVYYVQICGTRTLKPENANPDIEQRYSYGSIYIPPTDDISTTPVMISSPPLRIKKDADGADMIDESSITVEWDTNWLEAYNPADNRWYSSVGIGSSNQIIWGNSNNPEIHNLMEDLDKAENSMLVLSDSLQSKLGSADFDYTEFIAVRRMNLNGANYKMHVVKYEDMLSETNLTYEQYINNVLLDPMGTENNEGSIWNNSAVWQSITPLMDGNTPYYTVSGLDNNTAYVIFLRPYTVNASYYPAFVAGTTLDTRPPIQPVPTTPIIEIVTEDTTDTSITVRFTYTEGLEYRLYVSELLSDYPIGTAPIEWSELSANGTIQMATNTVTGRQEQYLYYKVQPLFPETIYYFWVGAAAEVNGQIIEKISNPTTETTKELQPPKPPRGFGPASANSLDVYNKTNETNIQAFDPNYLTYEWMRDAQDTGEIPESFAEGTAEALTSELLPEFLMAKFNELLPNKRYYARARTILTVTKNAEGYMDRSYSYQIQISLDEDYLDYIEITIPPLEGEPIPGQVLRKESEWTDNIGIFTSKGGDYDGLVNDAHYPLPLDDFEITYNGDTKTLTYRFRSNEKDAMGNNDNQVDQRFISRLYQSGVFHYSIDLSSYGASEINTREVIMPYSIFKAFNERKISIDFVSGQTTFTVAPGTFNTAEITAIKDFGAASKVRIATDNFVTVPLLTDTQAYVNTPQKISLSVTTPSRSVALKNLGADLTVNMKLDNRYAVIDANVAGYVADSNTGGWVRLNGNYNEVSGSITVTSKKPANYAAIAKKAPVLTSDTSKTNGEIDSAAVNSAINVNSRINMEDMPQVNPNAPISPNQFNQLIYALSKRQLSVSVNEPLSDEAQSALGKAGMLTAGSIVTREAGIHALVKLYENKAGRIRSSLTADESYFGDLDSVSGQYRASVLKAESIGMLDNFESLSPKLAMTYAEVLSILDIIISDAGM
ncbi:MAG: hypothetical protein LBS21_03510 [Clostridiales bacterium]|jgi:hypothetical protein|nr:hypothetical protein [Clostridiales bacterium]